ncbi:TIM44-like domain-containing protein [Zavarzinella formosa]|uniref:TIM44-like domain-containing protein n=1 Tax=Zavarzinella formosa TaxID=360055 RepID=UPI0002E67D5D|nr:TIM44-like domain-containing protein [Zavarzinella formosa]
MSLNDNVLLAAINFQEIRDIVIGVICAILGGAGILFIRFYKYLDTFYTPPNPNLKKQQIEEELRGEHKPVVDFKNERVPEWSIMPRDKATRVLLKLMAVQDKWLERKYLCEIFEEYYLLVREAMERRSVGQIENRLTEDQADELHTALKAMKKKGRRRIFGKVEVTDIHILQIETAGPKTKQTVTAMITAKSKDFVEDDETGKVVEGTKKTYYFQEFWTLRRGEKRWLVELIRSPADVDSVMEAKNVICKSDYEDLVAEAGPDVLEHVTAK